MGAWVVVESIVVGAPIGAGGERVVYLHPLKSDRVVKIAKEIHINRNVIDHEYLSLIGAKSILPKMYGWVETQLGPGLVYEHVRDANRQTSLGLGAALREGRVSIDEGRTLLKEALVRLRKDGIILHDDENVDNFLVQDAPSGRRLVMIDGFGPFVMTSKAKLRMRFPWLAREKTLRCAFNLLAAFEKEIAKLSQRARAAESA